MDFITEITQNTDMLMVAVVVGVIVAVITEAIKYFVTVELSTRQVQTFTLFAGWLLGMGAMFLADGTFPIYSLAGLAGGVWSQGIYDVIAKGVGFAPADSGSNDDPYEEDITEGEDY